MAGVAKEHCNPEYNSSSKHAEKYKFIKFGVNISYIISEIDAVLFFFFWEGEDRSGQHLK